MWTRAHGPWISALLVGTFWIGGCAPERDAELLAVGTVGPEWIEPGVEIRLTGEGFPVGRAPRVRFQGVVHRPAASPRDVDVSVEGRVVSSERITVAASHDLVEAVGGRGTFEGRVRVELEGAPGFGVLSGSTREVSLDFAPAGREAIRGEMARARRARAWLREVGLSLDEDDGARGLTVARVEPDGPAAAGGLREGDTLVWLDEVQLRTLGDLAGSAAVARRVRVGRPGVHGTLELSVGAVRGPTGGLPGMAWWMAGLILLAAWLGPLGRRLDAAAWSLARGLASAPRPRPLSMVGPGLAAVVASTAGSGVPGLGWLLWVAYAVADLATQRHRTVGARLRGGTVPLATVGAVVVASLCVEASPAGVPLASIHGMASGAHPLLIVAAAVAAACVFRGPAPSRQGAASAAVVHGLGAAWLAQLVTQPWSTTLDAAPWATPLLAVALAGLGPLLARRDPPNGRWGPWVAPLGVGVVCPAVAFGWLMADVPDWLAPALTPGLLAVGASAFLVGLARGVLLRHRGPWPPRRGRLLVVP